MDSRPRLTPFLSLLLRQPTELNDVLRHRRSTIRIAMIVLSDVFISTLALFAVIMGTVMTIRGESLNAQWMFYGITAFGLYRLFRELNWLQKESPVASALLWGGTIYIINGGKGYGFTTVRSVAEHPSILGAVEATIPGVLFFLRPTLRRLKPNQRYAEIPWTPQGIAGAVFGQQGQSRRDPIWD